MIETIKTAAVSVLVSGLITGIGIRYLQSYMDGKRKASEARAAKRREERRKAEILEANRRHALGRLSFWFHDAIVNGPAHANGDLEMAFQQFQAAEQAQKDFERELLAEHQDENRGG